MRLFTLLIFCFLLYSPLTFCQAPDQSASINEAHTGMVYNNNSIQIKAKRKIVSYDDARAGYDEIKGSPYLHEDAKPTVDLHMNSGEVVENATIQYDCYQNEIIANKGDQKEIVLETAYFDQIVSRQGELPYPLKRVNKENPNKFYEVLYQDSSLVFFKDTKVQLMHHTRNVPGMQSVDERFTRTESYYIARRKRPPVRINLKKADILRMVNSKHRSHLKKAMHALDIKKLKKEEDYVKAFNYSVPKSKKSSNL